MPESKEPKPNLPLIGIVLLAATVGGVYFYGKPFESLRPRERAIETSSTLGPQFVPARLWEDPFTAVSKRFGQQPDRKGLMGMFQYAPDHSADHLKKQIKKHAGKHGKVTIMPVMVFGGPYAEQIEGRRRKRYAVLSALAVSGYSPVDSEHIDYLQIPWAPRRLNSDQRTDDTGQCPFNQSSSGPHTSTGCLIIPYEWVVPSDKKIRPPDSNSEQHGPVLVLWLDDALFEDQPLSRLEQFTERLIGKHPTKNLRIKIIGPAGSTTLYAMAQEAPKSSPQLLSWLRSSEIYSPNATAPDTMLISENDTRTQYQKVPSIGNETTCENDKAECDARDYITRAFEHLGITFRRMIPTDNDLARSLKDELKRRRVDLMTPTNHIVLIAEWDTFYGRSLPATFSKVFTGCNEADATRKAVCPSNVSRYSYMRGLDGETPLQEKEAAKTSKEAGEVKRDSQTLEKAIGDSQFDYLRRLGSRIEREMEEIEGKGRVKAIGVLGSDVYGKLLILQALHERFPGTLFFTTDLDARYVHRVESKWTRNLIVGSGFGLELHSDRQGKIPPFRDSYQTAMFYAVQGALNNSLSTRPLTPRLFEIGRRQPIDLSVDQDPVHPKRQDSPVPDIKIIVILFGLASLLLWMIVRPRTGFLIGSGIVIVAPVVLIVWLVTSQEPLKGEPFDLWEGISLWPSEAIRLYALLLALGFIVQGVLSLRNSNKKLSVQYDLDTKCDSSVNRADIVGGVSRHRWRIWGSKYLAPWRMVADGEKSDEVTVQQLWAWYLEFSGGLPLFVRVVITSVVYLVFVRSLSVIIRGDNFTWEIITKIFTASGRFAPGRGEFSFLWDSRILQPAIFSLIGLIFFTVDATRLCRQFIKWLSCKPLRWSQHTLTKFAGERGMGAHPDDLSEWLALQLIAQRTRVVGHLVYYPFIVLLLMIAARSPLLDRWSQPWNLLLVFGLNAALVIGCAVALRSTAEKSRRWALDRLNQKLSQALEGEAARIERIRQLVHEVEANREGAFCPLSEQPVIRTILLFLGGSGSLIFLEYFIQSR